MQRAQYFVFKILNKIITPDSGKFRKISYALWNISLAVGAINSYILYVPFRSCSSVFAFPSIHPPSFLLPSSSTNLFVLCSWTFELQIHDRIVDRTAQHTKARSYREMHYCYCRHDPQRFNETSINTHVRCYVTFSVATRFVDWDFLGWLYCVVYIVKF